MTDKTFSLIGAGRMGQTHLQAALRLGLQVKAIYDSNQDSVNNLLSQFKDQSVVITSSVEEFLSTGVTDLLTIATTTPGRVDLIERMATAGFKKMVCEKPLAVSMKELNKIELICDSFGVTLGVNHQMRFMEQYSRVAKYQDEFNLGTLCSMTVNAANFGLGMNVTHYIEAFHWLTKSEIVRASGKVVRQRNPNVRGIRFFDYAGYALYENETGGLLFVDFQERISHHVIVVYNFEFGKITVNEISGTLEVDCRQSSDLNEPTSRYGLKNSHHSFQIMPAELLLSTSNLYSEVLKGGDYPSLTDGVRAVKCAIAVIYSTQLGGIPVNIEDPHLELMENLSWP